MLKKVYEDEIQVAYEDDSGARITSLKNKPSHDFWGNPYNQPKRSKSSTTRDDFVKHDYMLETPKAP